MSINLPSFKESFPDFVPGSRSVQEVSCRSMTVSASSGPPLATPHTRRDQLLSYSQSTNSATNLYLSSYNNRYLEDRPHQAYSATSVSNHTPQPSIPFHSTHGSWWYPSPVRRTSNSQSTSAPQSPIPPYSANGISNNRLYPNPASTSRTSRSPDARVTSGFPGSSSPLFDSTTDSTNATRVPQDDKSKGKYPCPYCVKVCKRRSELKNHVVMHTGERPFQCERCNGTFTNKSNYFRHVRNVHGIQPFDESNPGDARRQGDLRFIDEGWRFQPR